MSIGVSAGHFYCLNFKYLFESIRLTATQSKSILYATQHTFACILSLRRLDGHVRKWKSSKRIERDGEEKCIALVRFHQFNASQSDIA